MPMKKIPCPECNGLGYTLIANGPNLAKLYCRNCGSTGEIEAPMTNGDKIRAMTDEELARWLCSIMTGDCCDNTCPASELCEYGKNGLQAWIRQTAVGETVREKDEDASVKKDEE